MVLFNCKEDLVRLLLLWRLLQLLWRLLQLLWLLSLSLKLLQLPKGTKPAKKR